jgi:Pectate lyase superfamily protein
MGKKRNFLQAILQPATFKTLLVLTFGLIVIAQTSAADAEEFDGSFPSWHNLKTNYGAVGDGRADDTAAFQHALNDLTLHSNFCVLYVPAGHYRLTATIKTVRKKHNDCLGIAIVGESPQNTILQWDGPAGGTVFQYDAWYSKISRLTIDGAGRAAVALEYGPHFSTYDETSDMIFRDAGLGLLFGGSHSQGQAENEVLRCQFLHCPKAGLETANFNSRDIWVWYSRFEDCGYALFNAAGDFHAWQNLFLRSRVADVGSANLLVFSFVNNTSIGSARFLDFDNGHAWGSPTTISGNRIIDPTADFPLRLGNGGPYLVMDNTFKMPAGSTHYAAKMTWGDQTFVGNSYTTTNQVAENGRFRRVAEKFVNPADVNTNPPTLPPTPTLMHRPVIEIPVGAGGAFIQQAIDRADKLRGQRPVIHLPMGSYRITKTLVIPAGSDVQLVGDSAGETGSRLDWAGPAGGVLLKLQGPTHATLRDFYMHALNACALLVEDADQAGGEIFADELKVRGGFARTNTANSTVRVNGLKQTGVLFRCLQGSGNAGHWVEVIGSRASGQNSVVSGQARNQISIFTGATGSAGGQYNVVHGGHLVARGIYHEKSSDSLCGVSLDGSGVLAIDATRFSYLTSPRAPLVSLRDFHGIFTLASSVLLPVGSTNTCRLAITGNGGATHALALNDLFWDYEPGVTSADVWQNDAMPPAHGGLLGCNMNSQRGWFKNGFAFLSNLGNQAGLVKTADASAADENAVSDAELLHDLAPLREARVWLPGKVLPGATDLQIYRVMADGGQSATVEFR